MPIALILQLVEGLVPVIQQLINSSPGDQSQAQAHLDNFKSILAQHQAAAAAALTPDDQGEDDDDQGEDEGDAVSPSA